MQKLSHYRWIASLLGVVLAACTTGASPVPIEDAAADSDVPAQVFEGLYASAPAMSSFVPCEMGELPEPGKGYWLVPNDEFSQLYESPNGITPGDIGTTFGPYDQFAFYVRFEGILFTEAGKGYGHSRLYAGEVQVTRALETRRIWVGSTYPPASFRGCTFK